MRIYIILKKIIKLLAIFMPFVMVIGIMTGCTDIENTAKTQAVTAFKFQKGVYKTYSPDKKNSYKDYFYIFYDETSGYTEESERGIGLPFSCIQKNGYVRFRFGGATEPEEVFKIKYVKDQSVAGAFDNGSLLIFTPVSNANPDNFDAVEYVKNNGKKL